MERLARKLVYFAAMFLLFQLRSLGGPQVRFLSGTNDPQNRAVTDPVPAWHTYMGSAGDDYSNAIALDASGNIYLAGWSAATWGSPINPHSGGWDVFVAKLNSSGVLLWNTFLGSAGDDQGYGVDVDTSGNIYLGGYSNATWGTPVNPHSGEEDCFIAKLSSSGTLLWNTFLGSSGFDKPYDLDVDASGNAFICGWSGGTWGTPVNGHAAGPDGFVAKVNASGTLQWNTFLGGADVDICHSIAVDVSGNACVVGRSYATWGFPVNAYAGDAEAFAAKLNSSGVRLWNTFLGSATDDEGSSVAVDASGNLYVVGSSSASWGAPVSPFAGGETDPIEGDAYAAKLDTNGARVWNTFLGSASGGEMGLGVTVNARGDVFAFNNGTDVWGSPIYPLVTSVFACVTKLNNNGARLWNVFNRALPDKSSSLAVDASGNVYMGCTADVLWGTPVNPPAGGRDGFVAKFTEEPVWKPKHAVGDFDGDGSDGIAADFGLNGALRWDDGSWDQLTFNNPESIIAANIDGNSDDEIAMDFGTTGLWLWNGGTWTQLSGLNADFMTAGDVDADASDEIVGDFGSSGLWLWNGGGWSQLSGADAGYITTADTNGTGGAEVIGSFGALGLWSWSGGLWTQLSGVGADYLAAGDTDGLGGAELAGSFGTLGLWLWSNNVWTQLSGANPDFLVMADIDDSGDDEVIGDFWTAGLWLWDNDAWTPLSGYDPELMVAADIAGNGDSALAADFGLAGLWLWDDGSWSEISTASPKTLLVGNVDGDLNQELIVDFAALGLWLWNDWGWNQLTAEIPD